MQPYQQKDPDNLPPVLFVSEHYFRMHSISLSLFLVTAFSPLFTAHFAFQSLLRLLLLFQLPVHGPNRFTEGCTRRSGQRCG